MKIDPRKQDQNAGEQRETVYPRFLHLMKCETDRGVIIRGFADSKIGVVSHPYHKNSRQSNTRKSRYFFFAAFFASFAAFFGGFLAAFLAAILVSPFLVDSLTTR